MITYKDEQGIAGMRVAGRLASEVLDYLTPHVQPGITTNALDKLAFDYAPAFMREAQIRTAAEWKRPDLLAVTELVNTNRLSLDGLITHHGSPSQAKAAYETAFDDALCLKMVLDWSANA
jgi:3-hydroxyethyl bacteriochlorophyllide a dehydrogenase